MYPKFLSMIGKLAEPIYVTKQMQYFFRLLETVLQERSQSNQVFTGVAN